MKSAEEFKKFVKSSAAYDNELFRRCNNPIFETSRELAVRILEQWYPVTEVFCINSLAYCAFVAKLTVDRSLSMEKRSLLNQYLALALNIGAGEFEIQTKKPKNFHYLAFLRLAEKLEHREYDIVSEKYPPSAATKELTNLIIDYFNAESVEKGLAVFYVVETTAYNIVKMMKSVFEREKFGFNEYELQYIDKHFAVELEHASLADEMIELVTQMEFNMNNYIKYAKTLSATLGKYWNQYN